MKNFFTPEHVAIGLLVLNMFLKGFQDALGKHKDEKGGSKWLNVFLDTGIYMTAGRRPNV